jgi:hypothetical protein
MDPREENAGQDPRTARLAYRIVGIGSQLQKMPPPTRLAFR